MNVEFNGSRSNHSLSIIEIEMANSEERIAYNTPEFERNFLRRGYSFYFCRPRYSSSTCTRWRKPSSNKDYADHLFCIKSPLSIYNAILLQIYYMDFSTSCIQFFPLASTIYEVFWTFVAYGFIYSWILSSLLWIVDVGFPWIRGIVARSFSLGLQRTNCFRTSLVPLPWP